MVREVGLAGLSIRDLAQRVGITAPTIYAYFDSKIAIYDAMFNEAATAFAARMAEAYSEVAPRDVVIAVVHRFVDFCVNNPARYQLLFQRTLPGFEPSPAAYAPALEAQAIVRQRLARCGVDTGRQFDLYTAFYTGLVSQQLANDPGGDRWIGLIDESVDMLLDHCQRPPHRVPANLAPHQLPGGSP